MSQTMSTEACFIDTTSSESEEQMVSIDHSKMLEETMKMLVSMCGNEPEKLKELNDRFAIFIEKIHSLKRQNCSLKVELEYLQLHEIKQISSSYEERITKMRQEIETLTRQKAERDAELKGLDIRLQREITFRSEAEEKISVLIKENCEFRKTIQILEEKIKFLEEEIAFLKTNNKDIDIDYLKKIMKKICDNAGGADIDLTLILKKIREDISVITSGNTLEIEVLFKSQLEELNKTMRKKDEELIEAHQKITDFTRLIQSNTCEISSLRATIECLKNQTLRMVESHQLEVKSLQRTITSLKEKISAKEDEIMYYIRKYQGLHSCRVAMNLEIAAYKHLLEFEERSMQTSAASDVTQSDTSEMDLEVFRQEQGAKIREEIRIDHNEEISFRSSYQEISSAKTDEDQESPGDS